MRTISSSVTVQRSAPAVFDFLVDPRNQLEWSPNFLSLDTPPTAPLGRGTRFRGPLKNFGSMDLEYTEFEQPRAFEMATRHRMGRLTHGFVIDPEGDGARIKQTVGFAPAGVARLFAPFMMPMLRRMVADLDRQIAQSVHARVAQTVSP